MAFRRPVGVPTARDRAANSFENRCSTCIAAKIGCPAGGWSRLPVFMVNSLTLFFRPNYTPEDVVNLGNLLVATRSPATTPRRPVLGRVEVETCPVSLPIVGLIVYGIKNDLTR